MAAVSVTASSVAFENLGSVTMWTGDITSVDDADTFAAATQCGFGLIRSVNFVPTTAVVAVPTFSGTTITFKVAAGTVAGRLTVIGKKG